MAKRKPNQEVFKDGDKEIILVADFGFLEAVNSYGVDVSVLYSEISSGMMPAIHIRNILMSAMTDEIKDKKATAVDLIERYGLQECAIMASVMLSHAMIGDVKKCAIERKEELSSALENLTGSPSTNLKKATCLWMAQLTILTVLACTISRFLDPFIV